MNKLLIKCLVLFPVLAHAGGPLTIEGADGNSPVKYDNPNIVLNFDIGELGAKTNAEADALVVDGLNMWNGVTTSVINLTQGNDLGVDVDSSNYTGFMPSDTSDSNFEDGDGLNPVIYDHNGAIIDAFFGAGQSNFIAGFATSSFFIGGTTYEEGYAVINGKNLGLDDTQLTLLVAHEIGHFIGLDHTLTHIEETTLTACSTKAQSVYPLMYPFVCRHETTLHQDDIISVSTLYPTNDINSRYGQINGRFTQLSGAAILGANIFARNTSTNQVYSVISDYLKQGTGFFSIYLPPGDYSLHANSLGTDFTGGSSVGPYAFELTDASFQAPNPITPVSFEGTTPGSTEILTVTVGEANEVEFKLDGSGTVTTGAEIFTPTSTAAPPPSGDDGSGSLAGLTLLMLLLPAGFRLRVRRQI